MECFTVQVGSWLPTSQDNVPVPSSRVELNPKRWERPVPKWQKQATKAEQHHARAKTSLKNQSG